MKISIITVVYNNVATIADTIESVASQEYPDVEHIIIDGASTDGTVDVIARYRDRIARYVSEPDDGIYDAMNKGLALATGEVIGILNGDDVYYSRQVLNQVANAFVEPTVDACYADLVYMDQELSKIIRYWKSRPYVKGLFLKGWMPAHPTFYMRRRFYERFGGFDVRYKLQSDYELTLRFLESVQIKAIYIPEIFVKMRIGGVTNKSLGNILKGNLEAYRICREYHPGISPLFILKKIVSRIPQFFRTTPDVFFTGL